MKLIFVTLSVLFIAAQFWSSSNAAPKHKNPFQAVGDTLAGATAAVKDSPIVKLPVAALGGALSGTAAALGGGKPKRSVDMDIIGMRVERSPKHKISGSKVLEGAQLGAQVAGAFTGN